MNKFNTANGMHKYTNNNVTKHGSPQEHSKKISTIIRNQTIQKIRENERENENKVIEIKTTIVETDDNKGIVENLVDNIEKKSTKPLLKKSKTIGIKSPVWA